MWIKPRQFVTAGEDKNFKGIKCDWRHLDWDTNWVGPSFRNRKLEQIAVEREEMYGTKEPTVKHQQQSAPPSSLYNSEWNLVQGKRNESIYIYIFKKVSYFIIQAVVCSNSYSRWTDFIYWSSTTKNCSRLAFRKVRFIPNCDNMPLHIVTRFGMLSLLYVTGWRYRKWSAFQLGYINM